MYIVMEIQTNADGSVGTLVSSYADQNDAESKYHEILMYAPKSNLPSHACVMLSEQGFHIKNECYKHAPAPEPTTGEE